VVVRSFRAESMAAIRPGSFALLQSCFDSCAGTQRSHFESRGWMSLFQVPRSTFRTVSIIFPGRCWLEEVGFESGSFVGEIWPRLFTQSLSLRRRAIPELMAPLSWLPEFLWSQQRAILTVSGPLDILFGIQMMAWNRW
jgi:hypothetical protein